MIVDRELRSAIALGFSHLVGVTCTKWRPCKTETINKYTLVAFEAFKSARTHSEKMVTLMALRNTNLQPALERLIPFTKSGAASQALRPHIIFAMKFIDASNRSKFLSVIFPIIHNVTETTEIRIAAITTLFRTKPTILELQELVAVAVRDRNPEVVNFLLTSLRVSFMKHGLPLSSSLQLNLFVLCRALQRPTTHARQALPKV